MGHAAATKIIHTSAPQGAAVPAAAYKLDDPRLPLPRFIPEGEKHRPLPSPLRDALQFIKDGAMKRRFRETVDLRLVLGTDPKRGDHAVRGTAILPHGTGTTVRVAVFADPEDAAAAKEAGADVIVDEKLIDHIAAKGSGVIDFDKLVATKSVQSQLSKIARILGPRGLMPNAKVGTLTDDVAAAVRSLKAGRIEFRADRSAVLNTGIGKIDFSVEALEENALALVSAVLAARPKVLKGTNAKYMRRAGVSCTMGPGFPIDVTSLVAPRKAKD